MSTLEITRSIDIAAPPVKVWAALTEKDLIAQWFGDSAEFDPVVGGTGFFGWSDHGRFRVVVEQIEAPTLLVYRWANEADADPGPDNSTVVRFELAPIPGGTRLSLLETGFEALKNPESAHADNTGGWQAELDELVELLGVSV
ncbi:SRPBCC domain-containing protein [Mycobacterium sp. C31M]